MSFLAPDWSDVEDAQEDWNHEAKSSAKRKKGKKSKKNRLEPTKEKNHSFDKTESLINNGEDRSSVGWLLRRGLKFADFQEFEEFKKKGEKRKHKEDHGNCM